MSVAQRMRGRRHLADRRTVFEKTLFMCGTPAWLLLHRCPLVHLDLSKLSSSDSYLDAILIEQTGQMYVGRGFSLTMAGDAIAFSNKVPLAADGASELFESQSRLARVGFDSFVTLTADELDAVMSGGTRRAGAPCR